MPAGVGTLAVVGFVAARANLALVRFLAHKADHGTRALTISRCRRYRYAHRTMERFGFVGLPNAGKSSLYNALSGGSALAAPYAFATTTANVGVARVPDSRLDALSEMSRSKKTVPATVEFVDIGGPGRRGQSR